MAALARGGRRNRREAERVRSFVADVRGRGACHHPDGAARMVTSALAVFADDVEQHLHGRCRHD
jgi:NADH:ubiquinone oxidoreductase subunit F (NADH-binding)